VGPQRCGVRRAHQMVNPALNYGHNTYTSRKSLKLTSVTDCLYQCMEVKFRLSGNEFHTLTVKLFPVYRILCKTKTTTVQN